MYVKFVVPVVYADVKISFYVNFGHCVKFLGDLVCALLTAIFCCEEVYLRWFCMQEGHSVDIKKSMYSSMYL